MNNYFPNLNQNCSSPCPLTNFLPEITMSLYSREIMYTQQPFNDNSPCALKSIVLHAPHWSDAGQFAGDQHTNIIYCTSSQIYSMFCTERSDCINDFHYTTSRVSRQQDASWLQSPHFLKIYSNKKMVSLLFCADRNALIENQSMILHAIISIPFCILMNSSTGWIRQAAKHLILEKALPLQPAFFR